MHRTDPTILHRLVWLNKHRDLDQLLTEDTHDLDVEDAKYGHIKFINRFYGGMTALSLAIQLGRGECIRVLLAHGADCLQANKLFFSPIDDATSLGDRAIMKQILLARHDQIRDLWQVRQPQLLHRLQTDIPDFYLEMKWQFHSWVPFLSLLCPSDGYRVWKRGRWLRIDTTLVGFENLRWIRGNVTFLFHVDEEKSRFYLLDHDRRVVEEVSKLDVYTEKEVEEDLNLRLNTEIVTVKVKKGEANGEKKVRFTRQKTGLFGWGGEDKVDEIAGHQCAVYSVEGINVITRNRSEHLHNRLVKVNLNDDWDERLEEEDGDHLEGLIEEAKELAYRHVPSLDHHGIPSMTYHDFFSNPQPQEYNHVGRPLQMKEKQRSVKLDLWMAADYPLRIDQLMPVFEIMSPTNHHFNRLKEFISMDLPAGFPIQLEVPLMAILTARITFEDYQEWNTTVPEPNAMGGEKEEDWFKVPEDYAPGVVIKSIFKKYENQ